MKIYVNGVELYYETAGEGRPLIMVHGNGEDHTIFEEAAAKLSERFTCYLIDSRGHGQSTPQQTLNYSDMAEDVLAFMDALEIQQPVYYGFSDGGIIGLLCAIKRDQCFEKMILSGSNIQPNGVKTWLYALIKAMYFFKRDPKLKMMLEQPDIREEDLHKINVKTLILAGEKDVIRQEHTMQIYRNIKGAECCIIPKEDHGSYIVHSEKIADYILQFTE